MGEGCCSHNILAIYISIRFCISFPSATVFLSAPGFHNSGFPQLLVSTTCVFHNLCFPQLSFATTLLHNFENIHNYSLPCRGSPNPALHIHAHNSNSRQQGRPHARGAVPFLCSRDYASCLCSCGSVLIPSD